MRLPWRKRDEPPGVWRGKPDLYTRWRFGGQTYSLVTVDSSHRFDGSPSRITLEYMSTSDLEAMRRIPEGERL